MPEKMDFYLYEKFCNRVFKIPYDVFKDEILIVRDKSIDISCVFDSILELVELVRENPFYGVGIVDNYIGGFLTNERRYSVYLYDKVIGGASFNCKLYEEFYTYIGARLWLEFFKKGYDEYNDNSVEIVKNN